ncbi:MAG: DUF3108 domain-containing protein [Candidatus Omnitrophota bacterium]|nr:DUF3108 domain-containing protein [Candidatus Omnitrophota bacterium]
MRKIILILVIILLAAGIGYRALNKNLRSPGSLPPRVSLPGEKIIYDVRLGRVNLGILSLTNIGMVKLENRMLNLTTAETTLAQFKDKENIYSDPRDFFPVRIERDITKWLLREKITEDYDQVNFVVTITKKVGGRTSKKQIKSSSAIHNPMLLPYYLRHIPDLAVGKIITANLPSKRLEIELVAVEDIRVPAGAFKTYHFVSKPPQTEIWITADEQRIPVKIQDAGILSYSMLMRSYTPRSLDASNEINPAREIINP